MAHRTILADSRWAATHPAKTGLVQRPPLSSDAKTPVTPPTTDAPPAAAAPARRRFRAADVATQLDMAVIGDVCVGVSLSGYRSVMAGFLDDVSGSQALLLTALDRGECAALPALAHAVKGAAASMGLRAVHALAYRIETDGAAYTAADCATVAAALREQLDTTRALLHRMGFV